MPKIKKSPLIFVGLLIILFPWIARAIPAIEHYTDIFIFVGIYTLITIGLNLLMGYAGQISLGHAAFFGVGAYVSAILTTRYGIDPWLCMLVGMAVSGGIAFFVGTPALRLKGHYLAMATLAFGIIVYIVFNEEVNLTGGPDGMGDIPGLRIFAFELDSMEKYYYLVWGITTIVFLFSLNIIHSKTGRALRAIHTSESAAGAMGINVARYKIIIFIYSAMLASLAGSLYAHYLNFINPATFDLFFSIKLLIMIALGGMHTLWGAVLGACLISFLSMEWLHYFEEMEVIVYGIILLVVVMFMPQGIVGFPQTVKGWIKYFQS